MPTWPFPQSYNAVTHSPHTKTVPYKISLTVTFLHYRLKPNGNRLPTPTHMRAYLLLAEVRLHSRGDSLLWLSLTNNLHNEPPLPYEPCGPTSSASTSSCRPGTEFKRTSSVASSWTELKTVPLSFRRTTLIFHRTIFIFHRTKLISIKITLICNQDDTDF